MMDRNLESVVKRTAAGDRGAFEQLYLQTFDSILLQALQITRKQEDAEDVAQNVMVKLYKNLDQLKKVENFKPWIRRLIINECNDLYRKWYIKGRRLMTMDDLELLDQYGADDHTEILTHEYIEDAEKRQALLDAINALPVKSRQLLVMYYFDGLSSREISEATGLSDANVRMGLTRARGAMKAQLEQKFGAVQMLGAAQTALVMRELFQFQLENGLGDGVKETILNNCLGKMGELWGAKALALTFLQKAIATLTLVITVATLSLAVANYIRPYDSTNSLQEGLQAPDTVLGGSLEIEDTEDAVGSFDPPSSNELIVVSVHGSLVQLDAGGTVRKDAFSSLGPVQLQIVDETGAILLRTTSDATGNYTFPSLELFAGKQYSIIVELPQNSGLMLCGNAFTVEQGATDVHRKIYLVPTRSTLGVILFSDGGCDCGHVNPGSAVFVSSKDAAAVSWTITPAGSGEVLAAGSGNVVDTAFSELLESGEAGIYTLTFYHTGFDGTTLATHMDFRIYHGAIQDGMFG